VPIASSFWAAQVSAYNGGVAVTTLQTLLSVSLDYRTLLS
jgi:hypothetical protein